MNDDEFEEYEWGAEAYGEAEYNMLRGLLERFAVGDESVEGAKLGHFVLVAEWEFEDGHSTLVRLQSPKLSGWTRDGMLSWASS